MPDDIKPHAMWGGRFKEPMDPRLDRLNRSLPVDKRLWREDLKTNRAWVDALAGVGVLTADEQRALKSGLDQVEKKMADGAADGAGDEDIHSLSERLLGEVAGAVAGKLHTGRSRNDQVATDLRLWTMAALDRLDAAFLTLGQALVKQARASIDVLMPSYTHTQRAQPVRAAHWMLAHAFAIARDLERINGARRRTAVLPLGSGAIAGSGFNVDRVALAKALGFASPSPNSMDAVGDRDFAIESVFAAALAGTHLSRLAEDLILFSTPEFGFVVIAEPFTTGSSLMPQKRNPDALELVRGSAPQMAGRLVGMLGAMKAMPSGYQKDLQENNAALFAVLDTAEDAALLMAGVVERLTLVPRAMKAALDPATLATDLADLLVQGGVPFRRSHELVGSLVRRAEELGVTIDRVPESDVRGIDAGMPQVLARLGDAEAAVERRIVHGGTSRSSITVQIETAAKIFDR
ncbi:MAG TPA: argininosuccinate lyase [Gemmatimonadales bacterium]